MDCLSFQQGAARSQVLQAQQLAVVPPRVGAFPSANDPKMPTTAAIMTEPQASQDNILLKLDSILEEHSKLWSLMQDQKAASQEQHQSLCQRLDDVSKSMSSLSSSRWLKMGSDQAEARDDQREDVEQAIPAKLAAPVRDSSPKGPPGRRGSRVSRRSATDAAAAAKVEYVPSQLEKILTSNRFEIAMTLVIIFNTFTMMVDLQLRGLHQGYLLSERAASPGWEDHEQRLYVLELTFNSIYLVELVLRTWLLGRRFAYQFANILDFVIVVLSVLDSFFLEPANITFVNVSVLRLMRLTRIFRLAKFLRFSSVFSELRVLIRTLGFAIRGIVWSVVLLGLIVTGGGILMAQMANNFLDDESIAMERRVWLYKSLGTTMGAMHTMFESAFTGAWRFYSRPLIEEVSYFFAIFWISWVILVNFMTMRVVGALFLKQTMSICAADQEKNAMDQMKDRGVITDNLRQIFLSADSSGDGNMNIAEFERMMRQPQVISDFAQLGLDIDEVDALFSVLTSDDGCASLDEFINGALSMSGSSPTLDMLESRQNQFQIKSEVHRTLQAVMPMSQAFSHM